MPTVQTTSAKTAKTGGCERGGLRFGHKCVSRGVSLAREPLNMRVNPLIRTKTPRCARGRDCLRACHRARVSRMRSQKQKMDLKGSQASRRSPCLPGDDGGGDPEGPRPSLRAVTAPSALKSHPTSNT